MVPPRASVFEGIGMLRVAHSERPSSSVGLSVHTEREESHAMVVVFPAHSAIKRYSSCSVVAHCLDWVVYLLSAGAHSRCCLIECSRFRLLERLHMTLLLSPRAQARSCALG